MSDCISREAVLKKVRFYFNRGAAVEMVPADYVRRLPEVSPEAEVINKIKELIAEEIDNSRKRSWAAKQEYREGLAAAIGIIDAHLLRQQEGNECEK